MKNWVAWGLMVLVAVVCWGVFDAFAAAREETERRNSQVELRRAIAAEIPKGAAPSTVLMFLEKRKIPHAPYDADRRHVSATIEYPPRGWFQFGGGLYMDFW